MTRSERAAALWRDAWSPLDVGRYRLPAPALVALAAIGTMFLIAVARGAWTGPGDEHAYWLAGQRVLHGEPLYDLSLSPVTPYAYLYPPPFAQALAPVTAVVSSETFTALWIALLLGCLWLLALRNVIWALAMVAFVPVAAELWIRNVNLLFALFIVLGLRRWPTLFGIGGLIKIAPGLGIPYLAARGRWRAAVVASSVALLIVGVSVALDPADWGTYLALALGRSGSGTASLVPVPYVLRLATGLALALIAGRLTPRLGEPLLVVAVVAASPTLWGTTLSMLVAIVPLVLLNRRDEVPVREAVVADGGSRVRGALPADSASR